MTDELEARIRSYNWRTLAGLLDLEHEIELVEDQAQPQSGGGDQRRAPSLKFVGDLELEFPATPQTDPDEVFSGGPDGLPPPGSLPSEVKAPDPIRFPSFDVGAPIVQSSLVLTPSACMGTAPSVDELLTNPVHIGYNYRRSKIEPGHCRAGSR